MTKDYYKILGVAEFNTSEEIKTAYRKLARQYHPDVAGNSQEALLKFKDINEAYEILSNQVKKDEYDRMRRFYNYAKETKQETKQTTKDNTTQPEKNFNFNWEEFLSKKKRDKSFKQEDVKASKRGEDIYSEIEISVFEAVSGTSKTINMLQTEVCPKCEGRKFVNGSFCKYCNGKGEFTNYKKFCVKIPAGIKSGSKIRLAGEGGKGKNGGTAGDLYITVHVKEPQNYKTEGLNILKTIPIAPYEAVLGAEIKVPTIKGLVSVRITPHTHNGQKIRISGCGLVQNDNVGDMIITVEIQIPKELSAEETRLYMQLEKLSTHNIREDLYDR